MGVEQHLGESRQGGEVPAALDAHPMSISPRDVHVRMLLRAWPVGSGGGAGHGSLSSEKHSQLLCRVWAWLRGGGWSEKPTSELCFHGALLPCRFTASPAPALPAWLLLTCQGDTLVLLSPSGPSSEPGESPSRGPAACFHPFFSLPRTHLLSTTSQNGFVLGNIGHECVQVLIPLPGSWIMLMKLASFSALLSLSEKSIDPITLLPGAVIDI